MSLPKSPRSVLISMFHGPREGVPRSRWRADLDWLECETLYSRGLVRGLATVLAMAWALLRGPWGFLSFLVPLFGFGFDSSSFGSSFRFSKVLKIDQKE